MSERGSSDRDLDSERGSPSWRLAVGLVLGTVAALSLGSWWLLSSPPAPDRDTASPEPVPAAPTPSPDHEPLSVPEVRRDELPSTSPRATAEHRSLEHIGQVELHGRVTGPDGRVVAGASIAWDGTPVGTSDADGHYRARFPWSEVAPGRYGWLVASRDGVGSRVRPAPARSGRVDFELQPVGRVHGIVFSEGREDRVADAEVEVLITRAGADFPERPLLRATTRSDARGHFEFLGLPAGTCSFFVRHEDHASARWHRVESEGSIPRVELVVQRLQSLRGRFQPWPPMTLPSDTLRVVVDPPLGPGVPCDDEGRFELKLPRSPATQWLALRGDGGILDARRSPGPGDLGVMRLPDPVHIEGSVADGALLKGARVEVRAYLRDGKHVLSEPLATTLDDEGRFRLGPLPPREVVLGLYMQHRPIARTESLRLVEGETRRVPPFQLAGSIVQGRLLDGRGRAVSGLSVHVEHDADAGAPWRVLLSTPVDESGRWSLLLPRSARWNRRIVAVHPRRGRPARAELPDPLPPFREIELRLETGLAQAGRVIPREDRSLDGYAVLADHDELESDAVPTARQDALDPDGHFVLDGLEARAYELFLVAPDGERQRLGLGRPGPEPWTFEQPADGSSR